MNLRVRALVRGTALMVVLIATALFALLLPVSALGSPRGTIVLRLSGLPGRETAVVGLHGAGLNRELRIRRERTVKLPAGSYLLRVGRVVLRHGRRGVPAGAVAYPNRKRIKVVVSPRAVRKVSVRYAGVVNRGVMPLPRRVLGIRGNPADPSAVVLPLGDGRIRTGTIFVSGPTVKLPRGLVSKVVKVRRRGHGLVAALVAVPVNEAVPNLEFEGKLTLSPAAEPAASAQAAGPSALRGRSVGAQFGATKSSACKPPNLVRFGAHLDSVELRQASVGVWPPQMRLELAVRSTESLGVGAAAIGINCDWTLAEPVFQGAIPVGPVVIPVYASIPFTAGIHINGRFDVGTVHVASTTVATVAAGTRENRATLSQQGTNVWTSGVLSLSGSARLSASAGLQAGIGIARAGNVHVQADFGPEFDWSSGSPCELRLNLGSLSAGVSVFGKTFNTPGFTPLHPLLWSDCAAVHHPEGGGTGGGGTEGGGTEGGGTEGGGTGGGGNLWGYEASSEDAQIFSYDLGAGSPTATCVPPGSINGRGIAYDPSSGSLWYSYVDGGFNGDGYIHRVGLPPSCAELPSIPFGDGPGGSVQDDIGAIDVDPSDGNLWVAGYQPIGGNSYLYKVDKTSGAILRSCYVPFAGDGEGNDTLAVAKLSGLSGSGTYLLTDGGELSSASLMAVDAASCTGGNAGTVVQTWSLPVGVSGADYESGHLIVTDLSSIYDLGGPPFDTAEWIMSAGAIEGLEDISIANGSD